MPNDDASMPLLLWSTVIADGGHGLEWHQHVSKQLNRIFNFMSSQTTNGFGNEKINVIYIFFSLHIR